MSGDVVARRCHRRLLGGRGCGLRKCVADWVDIDVVAHVESCARRADGHILGVEGGEGEVVIRGNGGIVVAGLNKVELVAAGGHACLDGRGHANAVTSGFSRRGGGHFGGAGGRHSSSGR